MPADPSKAGRIGGSRNTPAQQAARKKNGFQPRKPAQEQPTELQPASGSVLPPAPAAPPVLIVPRPEGQ